MDNPSALDIWFGSFVWKAKDDGPKVFDVGPMSERTTSTTDASAVFLSYAREDTEAAGHIAAALRAAGVEVWFDMSELHGGDIWDQKIRRQIKECALFVALISANTQARGEGYFRREWKMAVDRTHDMSESRAFIVPVLIDDTAESKADVPEQFLRAHCTRLPGGKATPQFVEQVQRLLRAPRPIEARAKLDRSSSQPLLAGKPGVPVWAVALLGVIVLAVGAFFFLRGAPKAVSGLTAAREATDIAPQAVTAPAKGPDAKSIAVLPFVDMSAAKDQEYMSDGLAEELLNLLAKIPELHVAARTSAFSFKGKNLEIPEIAQRLHVAHVLEGSVRKSGNKLRITAQLIDARTGTHLWSESYDRELTDIFAVQDEIASAVAAQLKLALLGSAAKAKRTDPRAYELYLKAGHVIRQAKSDRYEQAIRILREAVAIDPNYASGWTTLALVYNGDAIQGDNAFLPIDDEVRLAREAVDKALALDPDLAWAHIALARIVIDHDGDTVAAAHHMEHALALEPGNPSMMQPAANLLTNLGRIDQSIALRTYGLARDPLNPLLQYNLGLNYYYAGRLDEAIAAVRTSLSLAPGRTLAHYVLGLALLAKGNASAALAEMQLETSHGWKAIGLPLAYHALGEKTKADATLATLIREREKGSAFNIATVLACRGETNRAFEWLEKAVAYHDSGISTIAYDPLLANLHSDPRWLPFLRKVGKAPEQLAAIKFDVKLPSQ